MAGSKHLSPIVWRIRWPDDIVRRFKTRDAKGDITINDLEMAAFLLQFLILEHCVDLKHQHAAAWCDNASTVSWTTKLSARSSKIGQRLIRALCLRQCVNQSSPLAPLTIAGSRNKMADLSSRSFKKAGKDTYELTDSQFLLKFNSDFPLTQEASWLLFRPSNKLLSLILSELRTTPLPMASWM